MSVLRWKIGDITITSIPESETPSNPKFLFKELDKKAAQDLAAKHPWLKPLFVDGRGMLNMKIQALVVDTGAHRIIVDTCVGNDKVRHNPGWNKLSTDFLARLEKAGYSPDTITEVFCTHLHVDHVGWNTKLVDGKWVPTFKNARYLFARDEFEHWKVTAYDDGDDIFGDSIKPIVDAGLAEVVDMNHTICPGIWFEPTVGHTPGHVTLRIDSNGQRALITGDMTHSPVQIAQPSLCSGFDWKPPMAHETRLKFFKKWAAEKVLVIGTHFATPTAGYIKDHGDRFELDVGKEGAKLAAESATRL